MSKLKMLLLCSVVFGLMFSPTARADRYVVAPGTPGANPEAPYDTWDKAATNIQDAVDAANAGETIWVSNGTYKATGAGAVVAGVTTMVYIAKDVILRSVNGPEVTILDGGYPDITNRPVAVNSAGAVFSGFTVVNGRGGRGGGIMIASNGGMVSNCVVCSNVSDYALNSGSDKYNGGGGIYSYATSGTGYVYNCSIHNNTSISNNGGGGWFRSTSVIRDCEFYANTSLYAVTSTSGGGGCYINDNTKAIRCVFSNNFADGAAHGYGGGVLLQFSTPSLDDCRIVNNSCKNSGAGFCVVECDSGSIMSNCLISGNIAGNGSGGGRLLSSIKDFKIVNCDIISNQAPKVCGGVNIGSGKVVIMDCLIASNSGECGGGVFCNHSMTNVAEIINCVIRDNTVSTKSGCAGLDLRAPIRMVGCLVVSNVITSTHSDSIGAGIKIQSADVVCENNTVVGNKTATGAGGGIYMTAGQVRNTIIYGNTSKAGLNQDWALDGAGAFTNCCTADITDMGGSGNIAADPEFVDAAEGDYHLTAASPCVNAGLNQDWMVAGVDKDGRPRLDRFVKQVDMGCYEYLPSGTAFFLR